MPGLFAAEFTLLGINRQLKQAWTGMDMDVNVDAKTPDISARPCIS